MSRDSRRNALFVQFRKRDLEYSLGIDAVRAFEPFANVLRIPPSVDTFAELNPINAATMPPSVFGFAATMLPYAGHRLTK